MTLKIKINFSLGSKTEAMKILDYLLAVAPKSSENTELFEDYLELSATLIGARNFEKAEKIIALLRETCENLNTVTRWMQLYDVLIKYYREKGDEEALLQMCKKYYAYSANHTAEFNRSMFSAIKNQLELDRSMEKQRMESEKAEELKLLSETDELTKLLNRRSFNNLAQRYYENAYHGQKPFALIILDIDHFKQYNDFHGHIAGDECLKIVARILKQHDGNGFLAARYGGDEFVVMVQERTIDEIRQYMESVVSDVAKSCLCYNFSDGENYITVSMGAARMIPPGGQTVMDLFQLADEELYRAKRNGKNGYSMHAGEE